MPCPDGNPGHAQNRGATYGGDRPCVGKRPASQEVMRSKQNSDKLISSRERTPLPETEKEENLPWFVLPRRLVHDTGVVGLYECLWSFQWPLKVGPQARVYECFTPVMGLIRHTNTNNYSSHCRSKMDVIEVQMRCIPSRTSFFPSFHSIGATPPLCSPIEDEVSETISKNQKRT